MNAKKIDGRAYAEGLRGRVKKAVDTLPAQPTLAVVMRSVEHKLPADSSEDEVVAIVRALNSDPNIDGILVQLPLPKGMNSDRVIEEIHPDKDVDGLTEASAGRLSLGKVLFLEQNCTVTIVHSRTKNIEKVCRSADILVPAVGRPQMVKADWVKPGACVIDVGINRVPSIKNPGKTRLVGDADYKSVRKVAGSVTPVPGGVGPMTIACLLRNTVIAACSRQGWDTPEGLDF